MVIDSLCVTRTLAADQEELSLNAYIQIRLQAAMSVLSVLSP